MQEYVYVSHTGFRLLTGSDINIQIHHARSSVPAEEIHSMCFHCVVSVSVSSAIQQFQQLAAFSLHVKVTFLTLQVLTLVQWQ